MLLYSRYWICDIVFKMMYTSYCVQDIVNATAKMGYSCLAPVCIQDIGLGAFYPSWYCPTYKKSNYSAQYRIFIFIYLHMYLYLHVQIISITCICICSVFFYWLVLYLLAFCILYLGFCRMSGVCDGCSGDWVIGLSNHINEAPQEELRPEQGIYGRSLSSYQTSLHHFHHCHHKYVHLNHHHDSQ